MNQFLYKETMLEMRALSSSEIADLQNGSYLGITLLGYHEKGDTPAPINYYLSQQTGQADDGGSVIEVGGVKLEHSFVEAVDPRYFGVVGDGLTDDSSAMQLALSYGVDVVVPKPLIVGIGTTVIMSNRTKLIGQGAIKWIGETYSGGLVRMGNFCELNGLTVLGNGIASIFVDYIGIVALNVKAAIVKNCQFYDWKSTTSNTGAGVVTFRSSHACTIRDCYFDESNSRFNDISAGYLSGESRYTNNVSYSNSDIFISTSIVGNVNIPGTEISTKVNHIITGNIHIKLRWGNTINGGWLGRHCIHTQYTGGYSRTVISNNIFGNCSRHGIYLRGDDIPDTNNSTVGPNVITGNMIQYCGRGDSSNYCSGIRAESNIPTVISGNYIMKSGYNPDGTLGSSPGHGIECVRGVRNIVIVANTIEDCSTSGISLRMSVSGKRMENVHVADNIIKGAMNGVYIANMVASNFFDKVKVSSNIIQMEGDHLGVYTEIQGTPNAYAISIENNVVSSVNKTGCGIAIDNGAVRSAVSISGNTLKNLQFGIRKFRYAANQEAYVLPRELLSLQIENNKIDSCERAFQFSSTTNTQVNVVSDTNQVSNCNFSGLVFTTDVSLDRYTHVFSGSVRKSSDSIINAIIRADNVPTAGEWLAGDVIENTSLANKSTKSWLCVESGNPGVWRPVGAIGATSVDAADAVSADYSQAEVQAILDELRDLKSKMRAAGLLAQ